MSWKAKCSKAEYGESERERKTVLVTGVSTGIGHGLASHLLGEGWHVYGCSRKTPQDLIERPHFTFKSIDLADHASIPDGLSALLDDQNYLDLVILNAGILGEILDLRKTDLKVLKQIMDVNVWANKLVVDHLAYNQIEMIQVVAISSGASVKGSRGWSGYAISKAALNMLTMLYAAELVDTHFSALAPGIVETGMQDYISTLEPNEDYPTIHRLQSSRGTPEMPDPDTAAVRLAAFIPTLREYPSGSYVDIRSVG